MKDVWAEIDLRSIYHNICQLKGLLAPSCKFMAVVKANAYGHGILEVAKQALASGADVLGVARINEAVRIRESGIDAPVLIFGYTGAEFAEMLCDLNLTQTVWSFQAAKRLSDAARSLGMKISVHVIMDTGMGRLGILPCNLGMQGSAGKIYQAALDEVESIIRLPGINPEGIYTHFATADAADKTSANRQFEIFINFLDRLKERGIEFEIRHAANSAAIIDMPETHLDMVRAGISVYGHYASEFVNKEKITLLPAMTLKSKVIHLKKVETGFKVSYGATAETSRPTTIATVAVGYGDGYSRQLSSLGKMSVCGHIAPVIGRVCMDQTMLDVGHIPDVCLGSEVVVFGEGYDRSVMVDEIAKNINTISYEVLSNISSRVERKYLV